MLDLTKWSGTQIKITAKYFLSTRFTTFSKSNTTKYWWRCGRCRDDENFHIPSAGMVIGTDALRNNLALLSKVDIFGNSAPFVGNSPRDHNMCIENM